MSELIKRESAEYKPKIGVEPDACVRLRAEIERLENRCASFEREANDHLAAWREQVERAERAEADAERWRVGSRIYFPEICGHDDSQPPGHHWYHQTLPGQWFKTPEEAIDAARKA